MRVSKASNECLESHDQTRDVWVRMVKRKSRWHSLDQSLLTALRICHPSFYQNRFDSFGDDYLRFGNQFAFTTGCVTTCRLFYKYYCDRFCT